MKRFVGPIFLLAMILITACTGRRGQLKPLVEPSDNGLILSDQPQLVTFSELQSDPESYRDRFIRVTGMYIPLLQPDCYPYSGPGAEWALISEGLRLDIIGFERLTRLISQDTIMTVDGFFRLYEGPIGCGKSAPFETAWFLEMLQIVQPNPLASSGRAAGGGGVPGVTPSLVSPTGTVLPGATSPPIDGTEQPTSIPTATLISTLPGIPTSTSTFTPQGTPPTAVTLTTTPLPSATALATSTLGPTPTRTPTTVPGLPTSTATSGPLPTSPPLPTATGGYPPAFPTVTPQPY